MPASDGVKVGCEPCRNCKFKCIPTPGTKCERCAKHNLACVIIPPPGTQAQREAQPGFNARRSHQSKIHADSDSEASFNSLFDEPASKSKSKPGLASRSDSLSTRKIGTKPNQTKNTDTTIVVNRQKTTAVIGKRPSERTPPQSGDQSGHKSNKSDGMPMDKKQRLATPAPTAPNPTTPRRTPVSPAPVAKMIPTERNLPKLSIPESVNTTPTPQPRTRETSISSKKSPPKLSIPQSVTTTPTPPPRTREPSTLTASTTKDLPSTPLTTTPIRSPHYLVSNTTLKIRLHGSLGFKPLLLKSCLEPRTFFPKILSTWSLPSSSSANTTNSLHITFPWLPKDHSNRLMILEPANVEAGLLCIRDEIERAPCWRSQDDNSNNNNNNNNNNNRTRYSVDVTIIPNPNPNSTPRRRQSSVQKNNPPATTRDDGRSIPDLSVDANRVYWAMRAAERAGLHVEEIATMVGGMSREDVVDAGNELLGHCLIFTGGEEYDIWSLLEG